MQKNEKINLLKFLTVILLSVLVFQGFNLLNTIKDIAIAQQDQIQIESQQLYNSNVFNCYTLNNKETEKEFYQCLYDAQ